MECVTSQEKSGTKEEQRPMYAENDDYTSLLTLKIAKVVSPDEKNQCEKTSVESTESWYFAHI
jgi:hypothetical protein